MRKIWDLIKTIIVFFGAVALLSLVVSGVWYAIDPKDGSFPFIKAVLHFLGTGSMTKPPSVLDAVIALAGVTAISLFAACFAFHMVWRNALTLGKTVTLKCINDKLYACIAVTARKDVYNLSVFMSYNDQSHILQPLKDIKVMPMLIRGSRFVAEFPIDYTTHLLYALRDMFSHGKGGEIFVIAKGTNRSCSRQSSTCKKLHITDFIIKQAPGSADSGLWIRNRIIKGRMPVDIKKVQVVHGEAIQVMPLSIRPASRLIQGMQVEVDFTKRNDDGSKDPFVSAYINYNDAPQNWQELYSNNATLEFDIMGDGNIKKCMLEVKFGMRLEKLIEYSITCGSDGMLRHISINLQEECNSLFGLEALADIREICFVVFEADQAENKTMSFSVMDLCVALA